LTNEKEFETREEIGVESVIDHYVETILAPHLVELEVAHLPGVLVAVVTDVRLRLQSLLARWQDHAVCTTLLLIGREEGTFYQPELAPLEIRALVVVAIRNSLLEELASSHAALWSPDFPRRTRPLVQDEGIRAITQEAIVYWQHVNLARLSLPVPSPAQDCFGHLHQDFPHAWHVLSRLAQATTSTISFPACQAPLPELPTSSSLAAGASKQVVVESGLSPHLDSHLLGTLRAIHNGQLDLLFTDSWKMLTRHPEKLFRLRACSSGKRGDPQLSVDGNDGLCASGIASPRVHGEGSRPQIPASDRSVNSTHTSTCTGIQALFVGIGSHKAAEDGSKPSRAGSRAMPCSKRRRSKRQHCAGENRPKC
jgi:hypothetical protein